MNNGHKVHYLGLYGRKVAAKLMERNVGNRVTIVITATGDRMYPKGTTLNAPAASVLAR